MISGRLIDGRPFVDALTVLPRLGVMASIAFLIDTGADTSTIHPYDAVGLGIDFSSAFENVTPRQLGGVGGLANEFEEACVVLLLHGSGQVDRLPCAMGIALPSRANG